jgi:hypothetical protein
MESRAAVRPVLTPALLLVVASVVTVIALRLAGHPPGGLTWMAVALVAGFSLSGSV